MDDDLAAFARRAPSEVERRRYAHDVVRALEVAFGPDHEAVAELRADALHNRWGDRSVSCRRLFLKKGGGGVWNVLSGLWSRLLISSYGFIARYQRRQWRHSGRGDARICRHDGGSKDGHARVGGCQGNTCPAPIFCQVFPFYCLCVRVRVSSISLQFPVADIIPVARRVCRRPTSARVRFSDEGEGDTVPSPRSISHLEHNLLDGHDILDDAEAAAPATASPARSRVKSLPLLRSYADRVRLAIRCVG